MRRFVHVSISNPTLDSHLPYFSGKADLEQTLQSSGLSFAILRPTVIFGQEDILINNIAHLLRRFPFFGVPGDGSYRLQPIYVEDMADLAIQAAQLDENFVWDAVGPEIYRFDELVKLIGEIVGRIRQTMDMETMLRTAATEIGRALRLHEVTVRLGAGNGSGVLDEKEGDGR